MPSNPGNRSESALNADARARLEAIRSAERLSELTDLTGTNSAHDAYFEAKSEWYDLRERQLPATPTRDGIPGDCVEIDEHEFWVHGITHADTPQERDFLREHVPRLLDEGAAIYCEQGIRSMYFSDVPPVCEMDDYLWAMNKCRELDIDSHVDDVSLSEFDGLTEDVNSLAAEFRDATFSLIESGGDVYGEEFKMVLGDVASYFLTSHENLATGDDFESFTTAQRAARNPDALVELQRYYKKSFLPQPLEREWLRRHDPELEVVTHARNERMADYVVYHNDEAPEVHLIVGAAHQPGVTHYLREYRDGEKRLDGFEPFG